MTAHPALHRLLLAALPAVLLITPVIPVQHAAAQQHAAAPQRAAARQPATARDGAVMSGTTIGVAPRKSAEVFPPDSVIRRILTQRVDAVMYPGVVVGLIDGRGMRVIASGESSPGHPADEHTVYELGSATKALTGTLLARMALRGDVALGDSVGALLAANTRMPASSGRPITLLDLATHRSGLPRMPSNFVPAAVRNPYADYSAARLYEFLRLHALRRPAGAQYEYSHLGMGLLGFGLGLRAGAGYASAMQTLLFAPLGMNESWASPAMPADALPRLSDGYSRINDLVGRWDFTDALAGMGGVRSTVHDLLLVAQAALDGRDSTAQAIRMAMAPRAATDTADTQIGLGWMRTARRGRTIIWHNGASAGHSSFIGIDSARHAAVVILAGSARDVTPLGMHLFDQKYPLDPVPAMKRRTEITLPAEALAEYVGHYEVNTSVVTDIKREDTGIVIEISRQRPHRMFAEAKDAFFLKSLDAQIRFERDAAGGITALILHMNGRDQRFARTRR